MAKSSFFFLQPSAQRPSIWRSEDMVKIQLIVQSISAFHTVAELGELGMVQLVDLNPHMSNFQRLYVGDVRRCEQLERQLVYFKSEIDKREIAVVDEDVPETVPTPNDVGEMETKFQHLEETMRAIAKNEEVLQRSYRELIELQSVLMHTQKFFEESSDFSNDALYVDNKGGDVEHDPSHNIAPNAVKLDFVAGVIQRSKFDIFERVLWRACRGNIFLRCHVMEHNVEDPVSGDMVAKDVFIIFFQGDQLQQRVRKICAGFSATLYPCPESAMERSDMSQQVDARIMELEGVLQKTREHSLTVFEKVADDYQAWLHKVIKIKSIYHTLNMFSKDLGKEALLAEAWCPKIEVDNITHSLDIARERSGSMVPSMLTRLHTKEIPPTYYRMTKFTRGFQALIDAYGISSYKEANPGLFAISTFPFLFAVMFGDVGHGIILMLIGLIMCLKEKSLVRFEKAGGEIFQIFFGGRYLILMMGIHSIYTGLIYNDMFSQSLSIFHSPLRAGLDLDAAFDLQYRFPNQTTNDTIYYETPDFKPSGIYAWGIDPMWALAENKLQFVNGYKMKMSIIMGVLQMNLGVFISLLNSTFYKNKLNVFFEFIPRILFLNCTFGYLVALIFFKWFDMGTGEHYPQLLTTLLNMFLSPGKVGESWRECIASDTNNVTRTCESDNVQIYPGQAMVQVVFLVVALICVPMMLCPKPFILKSQHKARVSKEAETFQKQYFEEATVISTPHDFDNEVVPEPGHGDSHDGEFSFGDAMTIQSIHTIEFCLGCISNTASYLRLWALSLAHAKLSETIWDYILVQGILLGGSVAGQSPAVYVVVPLILWGAMWMWMTLTVGILLLMEGLSAFLHCLRLHWVEFGNKFFTGSGHAFEPFSFTAIIKEAEEI